MANFSFDVVNELDKAEVNNVFEQVKRDISNRYDFKGTVADISWLNDQKSGFKIIAESDIQLEAIIELVRLALGRRNQSQKLLDLTSEEVITNMKISKEVPFKQGISGEDAKLLSKVVRDNFPKLKCQIQGETLRISASAKDDLQKAIALIRQQDLDYPIQFTNYR